MTALSANITDAQTLIPVDAGLTNGTFQYPLYYTVDSESIRVIGRAHETSWLVDRGIAGTTAASHSSAASLTRYYPEAASSGEAGGSLTLDNTVDPPAEVTTIISPAAALDGSTAYTRPVILSETDPSDVSWSGDSNYDGLLWLQTDELANVALRVWESGNGIWLDAGIGDMLAGNSFEMNGYSANGTEGDATFEFGGNPSGIIRLHLKDEDGANDRNYELKLGNSAVSLFFTDPDAESPDNAILMNNSGILLTGWIGFYGSSPIARPTGVAVTAEAVHAALVSLGLIEGP